MMNCLRAKLSAIDLNSYILFYSFCSPTEFLVDIHIGICIIIVVVHFDVGRLCAIGTHSFLQYCCHLILFQFQLVDLCPVVTAISIVLFTFVANLITYS